MDIEKLKKAAAELGRDEDFFINTFKQVSVDGLNEDQFIEMVRTELEKYKDLQGWLDKATIGDIMGTLLYNAEGITIMVNDVQIIQSCANIKLMAQAIADKIEFKNRMDRMSRQN